MSPLRVLIASNAFKDVFSPTEACDIINQAFIKSFKSTHTLQTEVHPIADGGEYSLDVVQQNEPATEVLTTEIVGPDGTPRSARYLKRKDGSAFIASYEALRLDANQEHLKNPYALTSYGMGQLLLDAISKNLNPIYIGLGGTHTADGGIGMAQALGVQFSNFQGNKAKPIKGDYFTAEDLPHIHSFSVSDCDSGLSKFRVVALWDGCVTLDELFTPTSMKFSNPQGEDIQELTSNLIESLKSYSNVIDQALGSKGHLRSAALPGIGAAGAVGLSLLPLCEVEFESGFDFIFRAGGLSRKLDFDLAITGEGRFDNSLVGKAPIAFARKMAEQGIPVLYVTGAVDDQISSLFQNDMCLDLPRQLHDSGIRAMIRVGPEACHNTTLQPNEYFRQKTPGRCQELFAKLKLEDLI